MKITRLEDAPVYAAYIAARTASEIATDACWVNSRLWNAECLRLGLTGPYAQLPADHPLQAPAQALCEAAHTARAVLCAAVERVGQWTDDQTAECHA